MKKSKRVLEIERLELMYQIKIHFKYNEKLQKTVWETIYKETTVYSDTLEGLENVLKHLKESED